MLFKIAFRNVRRQIGNYLVYFITVSLIVALLFSVNTLVFSDIMEEISWTMPIEFMRVLLLFVVCIMAAAVAFVLGYATVFLLQRRKREFGVCLTLGMTRGDVLKIFAGETGITFLLSLGMGLLLGLVFYQVLAAGFMRFLETEYVFAAYSPGGFFCTVGMVAGMFLLSSVAALVYLRYQKITALLQGDRAAGRKVKRPALWAAVFVLSVVGIVASVLWIGNWLGGDVGSLSDRAWELFASLALFFLSAGLFSAAFSRSLLWFALRCKRLTFRGAGVFTARALSSRLTASSLMMGVLSVLLCAAIVGMNIFFSLNTVMETDIRKANPFDITAARAAETSASSDYGEELSLIGEYAPVRQSHVYTVYKYYSETVVTESDFSILCNMSGYSMPALNGGYLECGQSWGEGEEGVLSPPSEGKAPLVIGGVEYPCVGYFNVPDNLIVRTRNLVGPFFVLPDEAVRAAGGGCRAESQSLAVMLAVRHYDVAGLKDALSARGDGTGTGTNYRFYESLRLDAVQQFAPVLLMSFFVSAVFVLMTMAMLSLKILSAVSEDRMRYRILRYLGVSEGMLAKSLCTQIFFFCFLPFAVPVGVCFPLVGILERMISFAGASLPAGALALQVAATAGVVLLLCALYFAATGFAAWRDIKKTLRAVG